MPKRFTRLRIDDSDSDSGSDKNGVHEQTKTELDKQKKHFGGGFQKASSYIASQNASPTRASANKDQYPIELSVNRTLNNSEEVAVKAPETVSNTKRLLVSPQNEEIKRKRDRKSGFEGIWSHKLESEETDTHFAKLKVFHIFLNQNIHVNITLYCVTIFGPCHY